MRAICILFCLLFSLVAYATEAPDVSTCKCQDDITDCSFRTKTVLMERDFCRSTSTLNVRGNNLRQPPIIFVTNSYQKFDVVYDYDYTKIDASMNEFGLSQFSLRNTRIKVIDLSSNYLNNMNFLNYLDAYNGDLKVLNVSNNAISKIDDEICHWFQLEIFRIANNRISELRNNSCSPSSSLRFLDLSGNPLHTVSPSAFSSLRQLETLDLSETRHLASLAEDTFSALGGLRHLRLSGNKLARLPSGLLAPLQALESLQLQRNALAQLPADAFSALSRLRVLNLDSNLLDALPPQLFARLHSLQHLSARDNRLAAVPSLRLCAGPLRTALFTGNAIAAADEAAVRALWRPGFELMDVTGNPLTSQAWQWASNASDVSVSPVQKSIFCTNSLNLWRIQLKVGYGFIKTCLK